MFGDAGFDVLGARCVVPVGSFRRQLIAADGTLVFLGDLATRSGLRGGRRSGRSLREKSPSEHSGAGVAS